MKDKFNIVFCKYTHGRKNHDIERCYNCDKTCPSVSNIIHGKILKLPVIKQIYDWCYQKNFDRLCNLYAKDYISEYETTSRKFIWGIMSWDCLSSNHANLDTMNDIDLIYLKDEDKYILSIETIYYFEEEKYKLEYLKGCLSAFTKFMEENKYDTDNKLYWMNIFSGGLSMNKHFDSIEDCYSTFKMLVRGYCGE